MKINMAQTRKIRREIIFLAVLSLFFYAVAPVFAQAADNTAAEISGCVYHDANSNNAIEAEEMGLAGWGITLEDCGNYSFGEGGVENFNFNTQEQCVFAKSAVTNQYGCYSFKGLSGGQYRVREILSDGWSESYPGGFYYNIELTEGEKLAGIDFANFRVDTAASAPVCGNGIKELNEICDGQDGLADGYFCDSDCLLEPNPAPEVMGEAGAPNLTVGKIVAGRDGTSGDIIYKIFLANNGNLAAYNVYIVDTLPAGLTFSGTAADTKTWDLGDIAPGEIKDLVYTVTPQAGLPDGDYTNTATVRASNHSAVSASAVLALVNGSGTGTEAAGTEGVAVLGEEGAPALALKVTSDRDFANPGDHIAFHIVAVNEGDLTAFGVKIVATIDHGLKFPDTTGSAKQWQFDSILPHETKDIYFTADAESEPGTYAIAASAGAANNEVVSDALDFEVRPVEVLGIESEPDQTAVSAAAGTTAGETSLPVTGADYERWLALFLNCILGLFISMLLAIFIKNRKEFSR